MITLASNCFLSLFVSVLRFPYVSFFFFFPTGPSQPTPLVTNQGTPNRAPTSSSQGKPNRVPPSSSQGKPNRVPTSSSQGTPKRVPTSSSQGTPNRVPTSSSQGTPKHVPPSSSQVTPNRVPPSSSQVTPKQLPTLTSLPSSLVTSNPQTGQTSPPSSKTQGALILFLYFFEFLRLSDLVPTISRIK